MKQLTKLWCICGKPILSGQFLEHWRKEHRELSKLLKLTSKESE